MSRRIFDVASKALKPIARLAWLSTLALFLGSLVDADAESANRPWRDSLQTEYVWQLPAGEEMGLAGLRYQRQFDSHHAVGLETWMAMTGHRGGSITLGLDGGCRFAVGDDAALDFGCFVSVGGSEGAIP